MRIILAAARVEQEEREVEEAARAIVEDTPIDVEESAQEPPEGIEPNDATRNIPSAREANEISGATSSDDASTEAAATLVSFLIVSA